MPTSNSLSSEVCTTLQTRLKSAEAHVNEALAVTEPSHPLAGPTKELLAVHNEIRDLLLNSYTSEPKSGDSDSSPKVTHAAIELEREEHTAKADFMDVVKALFLWKDDPQDRAKEGP